MKTLVKRLRRVDRLLVSMKKKYDPLAKPRICLPPGAWPNHGPHVKTNKQVMVVVGLLSLLFHPQ
eukprot:10960795-Prorocentrum_lima.AAC.1